MLSNGFKNLPVSEICFPSQVNFFQSNNPKKICNIDLTRFNDRFLRETLTVTAYARNVGLE